MIVKRKYFMNSERIGFSRWNENDLSLALSLWGDFEVTKYFDSRGRFTNEMVSDRLRKEIDQDKNFGVQYWPVFNLKTDGFIGACGLRPYNIKENIYETGFHVTYSNWGNGYASEAASRVIEYAFVKLKADKIFAGHNPENKASEHLLRKLGFVYSHDEFYKPTGLNHPSYFLKRDGWN